MLTPRPNQLTGRGLTVSQEELVYRPLNLYPAPHADGRRRIGIKINAARKGFQDGKAFYDKIGNPYTIYDLPARKTVILHCTGGAKLQLQIPLNIGNAEQ